MRRWLLVVVTLSGCRGILGIDEGTVASDATPVVDDMAVIDMAIDGMPDLDTDDDGVDDVTDNCDEIQNADQRNFDGDTLGDACDPCPHLVDGNADFDNDGVGDACDPRPIIAGDRRLLWVTFQSANDIVGWNSNTVNDWSVDQGALLQGDVTAQTQIALPGVVGNGYLASSADIVTPGGAPYIGICSHFSTTEFLCCDVTSGANQNATANTESQSAGGMWIAGGYAAGTRIDIEQRSEASAFRCTFKENGLTRDQSLAQQRPDANLVLHVRSTVVRFRYVFFSYTPP